MKILFQSAILFALLFSCTDSNPLLNVQSQKNWESHEGFNSKATDIILFASSRNFGTNFSPSLYSINSKTSEIYAITPNHLAFSAAWSPNKWKFLFIGYDASQVHSSLFVSDYDGKNIKRISNKNQCIIGKAEWSPDGNRIVFIEKDTLDQYWSGRIIISDPDGGNQTILTDWLHDINKVSWSKDSRTIYFNCFLEDGKESVYKIDSSGNNFTRVFMFEHACYTPTVSPDNKYIAFASFFLVEGEFRSKIFIYNIASKNIKVLNVNNNSDYSPSWTYDSKEIVFQTRKMIDSINYFDSIIKLNIETGEVKEITNPEAIDYNPCAYK